MRYRVGVMMMDVEGKDSERFRSRAAAATREFGDVVSESLGVGVELLTFEGPHLTPAGGGYEPLDFLQIGTTEKIERDVHFLLILTEVDLAARSSSYTLALPRQLTNVGVVSLKRLDPAFEVWDVGSTVELYQLAVLSLLAVGTATVVLYRSFAFGGADGDVADRRSRVRTLDHVKLGMFVAALGVLAGSLGGRADRKEVVRTVLFVDEET